MATTNIQQVREIRAAIENAIHQAHQFNQLIEALPAKERRRWKSRLGDATYALIDTLANELGTP